MTTALYVLGCCLTAGGAVLFYLAAPEGRACARDRRNDAGAAPPPTVLPVCPPERCAADDGRSWGDDFALWERELLSGSRVGREHDQRARRDLSRWERDSRRHRRGR
jgi:hypothetical protein